MTAKYTLNNTAKIRPQICSKCKFNAPFGITFWQGAELMSAWCVNDDGINTLVPDDNHCPFFKFWLHDLITAIYAHMDKNAKSSANVKESGRKRFNTKKL